MLYELGFIKARPPHTLNSEAVLAELGPFPVGPVPRDPGAHDAGWVVPIRSNPGQLMLIMLARLGTLAETPGSCCS